MKVMLEVDTDKVENELNFVVDNLKANFYMKPEFVQNALIEDVKVYQNIGLDIRQKSDGHFKVTKKE